MHGCAIDRTVCRDLCLLVLGEVEPGVLVGVAVETEMDLIGWRPLCADWSLA